MSCERPARGGEGRNMRARYGATMRHGSRTFAFAGALVVALGVPRLALAEEAAHAAGTSDVRQRFTESVQLFKAGEIERALPGFQAVASASASPNASLYVGYCLTKLGRYAEAYAAFERAIKDAGTEERYEETRTAAGGELSALNVRVSKLVVSLLEQPPGLVVKVDGEVLEPARFGTHRVLPTGAHHVEAEAPGLEPVVRDVSLEGGETKTVTLAFAKKDEATTAPPPRDENADNRGAFRTAGFVSAGVGLAGVAAFVVGGLQAQSAHAELEDDCARSPCSDVEHVRVADRGKTWQTVANVGLVVGGVGAAASAALLYVGFKTGEKSAVSAAPLGDGGVVTWRARF